MVSDTLLLSRPREVVYLRVRMMHSGYADDDLDREERGCVSSWFIRREQ